MGKRRTIGIVLILLLLFSGCVGNTNLETLKQVYAQEQPVYSAYPMMTYSGDYVYTVVILSNSKVIKGVEFSADRIPNYTVDMKLIQLEDIQIYLGNALNDVENALGEYHVDIGSGGFMPSYVTDDGYLITFSVDQDTNVVEHVGKTDLFSGESVEWYFLHGTTD